MSSDGVVYIVDDEEAVRRSIARLVRSVGLRAETFPSAQAFLAQKVGDEPACLVLDVRLPDQSGLDLQAAMGPSQRSMPIIFITGRGNVPMSVRAMKEGALDFLEKPFESEALLEAIQRALAKSREGREVETERAAIERRLATLSPRERQVLALMAEGRSNHAIATELVVTERAVEKHVTSIFTKLNLPPTADDHRRVLAVLTYLKA